MVKVFLGLGSNVGDNYENLRNAVKKLMNIMIIEKCSKVYETQPWGYTAQNNFLNMCVSGETRFDAIELLNELKRIEHELGRKPTFRWGPRVIDIDILYYGNKVIDDDNLVIPHPELKNRSFVLVPLCDIAPDYIHPILGKTNLELLAEISHDDVRFYSNFTFE